MSNEINFKTVNLRLINCACALNKNVLKDAYSPVKIVYNTIISFTIISVPNLNGGLKSDDG